MGVRSKARRWKEPRLRWFWAYAGRDFYNAIWGTAWFGLIGRRDLMTRPEDEGCMTLRAFEVGVRLGPTFEDMEDERWWRWVFRLWIRSDASEIAERLAGGPE